MLALKGLQRVSTRGSMGLSPKMGISMMSTRTKVTLPDLDWDFGDLEPHISGKINELHYTKHHQTYVNGFNAATEQLGELECKLTGDTQQDVPVTTKIVALQKNLNFHGGGFTNHCLFWKNLAPSSQGGGELPSGKFADQIKDQFGSLEELQKLTNAKLAGIQGSGWAFIVKNLDNGGAIDVVQTYNQDTVTGPLRPLVAIDAWEHAYYLQYQNRKADYFKAIWNVINWKEAARRFDA
ncbi:LAMI_0H02960g1_1 [Lachancea mirantina]|uniref:Superoxide dismutase n=1 Tax=Lachancea mirantina TaxID=1230905 RepID=A0A1G4KE43_9SACH|nr:LAMI_0H02960g1_1 [Lachancea mirantina]